MRPGREHDVTALCAHIEMLPVHYMDLRDPPVLGDLGYEGEPGIVVERCGAW
jgi:hypothetical protein